MEVIIYASNLTDKEWSIIEPYIRKKKKGRPTTIDRREIVNAILYQSRTGCQWSMLPKDFPCHKTVTHYYYRWLVNGTLERIHQELVAKCRALMGKKR